MWKYSLIPLAKGDVTNLLRSRHRIRFAVALLELVVRFFGRIRKRICDLRLFGDHAASKEPTNPCPEWIRRFL